MSTITASRRRQLRYTLPREKGAVVEFEHPSPKGRHFRLPLTDISASGVSFATTVEEGPGLESGATVPQVLVRVGSCMIRGDLVIMHLTEGEGSSLIFGALLYPDSDADLVKLKSVIAGMEAIAER